MAFSHLERSFKFRFYRATNQKSRRNTVRAWLCFLSFPFFFRETSVRPSLRAEVIREITPPSVIWQLEPVRSGRAGAWRGHGMGSGHCDPALGLVGSVGPGRQPWGCRRWGAVRDRQRSTGFKVWGQGGCHGAPRRGFQNLLRGFGQEGWEGRRWKQKKVMGALTLTQSTGNARSGEDFGPWAAPTSSRSQKAPWLLPELPQGRCSGTEGRQGKASGWEIICCPPSGAAGTGSRQRRAQGGSKQPGDGRTDVPRWLERNSRRPSRSSAGSGVKSPSFCVTSLNNLVARGEVKGCHQLHSSSTAASGSARPAAPLGLRRTRRRKRVVGPPAPPAAWNQGLPRHRQQDRAGMCGEVLGETENIKITAYEGSSLKSRLCLNTELFRLSTGRGVRAARWREERTDPYVTALQRTTEGNVQPRCLQQRGRQEQTLTLLQTELRQIITGWALLRENNNAFSPVNRNGKKTQNQTHKPTPKPS